MAIIWSKSLTTNNSGWAGHCIRVVASGLSSGGTELRATFVAATSGNHFRTDHVSVGIGASPAPNTTATPVPVLFSGAHGFDISPGQSITSDPVTITWVATDTLVFNMDLNASVSVDFRITPVGGSGAFFKPSSALWQTAAVSGFTSPGYVSFGLSQIETTGAPPAPPAGGDLVVIGDSVSVGVRSGVWAAGQGYGALLAAARGLTEVNLAAGGTTVSQMQSQWNAALARSPKPAVIVAMLGENDINVSGVASFKSIIDSQVASAVAAGIPVILATPWINDIASYMAVSPDYVQAVREVAWKYKARCIDVFDALCEVKATNASLYTSLALSDGHPTAAGQAWIKALYERPQNKGAWYV